jgi:hypothetical protein
MIAETVLQHPPFRLSSNLDSIETGKSIADCIEHCASLSTPLTSIFSAAMLISDASTIDPLYRAGMAIARDIDAGVGAGIDNAYHNKNHLCEVLLCAIAISNLVSLSSHEKTLLFIAAMAHDFHHDGRHNVQPYRLELQAAAETESYLTSAGVSEQDRKTISTLIWATETQNGVLTARACYAKHFLNIDKARSDTTVDFSSLKNDARLALLALILTEADVLPSVGLTIEHAESTAARLGQEWGQPMTAKSKIDFIDNFVGDMLVAKYFMPNVRMVRHAFSVAG